MRKLIAARPIQYMGRTYARGDAVPAYDGKMVEAWLSAGSVAWTGSDAVEPAGAKADADTQAADALREMGVSITDDAGNFVGAENLAEQIRSMAATPTENSQNGTQGDGNGQDGQEPTDGKDNTQSSQEAAGEPEMVTGHLDAAQLERMTKPELIELAEKMNVDISTAKNNTERAAMIAAVEVQAPKNENGGAR
ncbi:MAG: hypothetical protein LKK00_01635 [Intestinimonas sp.]|jgi:cobalamin biosynthesis protein CobT|nr:hypothetical protein [Intestinimonas sp.]